MRPGTVMPGPAEDVLAGIVVIELIVVTVVIEVTVVTSTGTGEDGGHRWPGIDRDRPGRHG